MLAVFIAAMLEEFLSTSIIERFIGTAKPGAVFSATVIGALVPLCTCGMIPLSASLKRKNAHWIPLIGFLTAGVASSIPALLLTLTIGLEMTLLRLASALVFGFVVAYVAGYFLTKHVEDEEVSKKEMHHICKDPAVCDLCEHRSEKELWSTPRWKEVLEDFTLTLKDFTPWLVVSIVAAALITAMVPESFVQSVLGSKAFYGPFIGSLIGMPFYLCAGADVPLVAALFNKGANIGTLVSIMTAAPTVNIPAAGVLSKWIGRKGALIYLAVSWLVASLVGVIVNLVY